MCFFHLSTIPSIILCALAVLSEEVAKLSQTLIQVQSNAAAPCGAAPAPAEAGGARGAAAGTEGLACPCPCCVEAAGVWVSPCSTGRRKVQGGLCPSLSLHK